MYCRIQKKADNFGQWNTKTFQLANCALIQYEKEVMSAEQCDDKSMKQRFNIYKIEDIQLGKADEPYHLAVIFPKRTLKLQWKEKDQMSFIAMFRILCSAQTQSLELDQAKNGKNKSTECLQRALPSNLCFALYVVLQNLYKHKDILRTRHIFKSRQHNSMDSRQLYENLIVKGRKYTKPSIKQSFEDDIQLLSHTLLYTLQNMPTSLLCDSYCRPLTEFVSQIMEDAERECMALKAYHSRLEKIPKDEDRDILIVNLKKEEIINKIRNEMQKRYTTAQYKEENGFTLNNRFGFMTILFSLLSNISSHQYYDTTAMSAPDLAIVFADVLQSKQYLFQKQAQQFKAKHTNYEQNFVKMIKIFIYFAQDIFPSLRENKWKVSSLVFAQGTERSKVHKYNGHYSRDVKNEYFIGTVLRHKTSDYGTYFDAKYHIDEYHEDTSSSATSSEEQKYEIKKQTLQVPKPGPKKQKRKAVPKKAVASNKVVSKPGRQYKVMALQSMRQIPQTHSDIGVSTDEEVVFEPDPPPVILPPPPAPAPAPAAPLEVIPDEEQKYEQQVMEQTYQEIEQTVYHNDDMSVRSLLAQCEICFYEPFLKLFDGSRNNRNRNTNRNGAYYKMDSVALYEQEYESNQ